MAARRARVPLALGAAGVLAVSGTLLLASTGAVAQSRAANRWNHAGATLRGQAAPPAAQGRERAGNVIRLTELFTDSFTFVDTGDAGDSIGDYGVFSDPVADTKSGRVVGRIDVQCIAAYVDQCRGSISLDGRGQITFDGVTPVDVDPDVFAVTGGTGRFAGVGGTMTVEFAGDEAARLIVRLAP